MKKLLQSVFIITGLTFACATLISCENRGQPTHREKKEQPIESRSQNTEKIPTLNHIVEYQNTMETKLDEIDKRIEELKTQAERSGSDTKTEFKEEIADLNWKKEYAHKKLDELKSASAEVWNDVKSEMDSTMDDLESSYENTISRFRQYPRKS